jgi:hypothetical protein
MMNVKRQKLPIGIQSFAKLREGNHYDRCRVQPRTENGGGFVVEEAGGA